MLVEKSKYGGGQEWFQKTWLSLSNLEMMRLTGSAPAITQALLPDKGTKRA